jgi:cellulose synthase/poly-beta-1,6-N-acetylglucosamine synthase-like glycosyltransferase
MELLPIIYLAYMFVSIYFLAFFLLLYFNNKKTLFDYPETKKNYSVSFVIPAYNEGETIADTIEHIFSIDYNNIIQVIVVNDCSTDNTIEVVEHLKKKYPSLILINNEENLGNAAKSKNVGLKYATGELIAFVDADSYPAKDSLKKMIGFFDNEKVGAVTCPILVRNAKNFLEKLQEIEYKVIAFTRKLLGYVDAIYVTPGPLAIYRKEAINEVGGFDGDNLTEDIEITWHLTANNWKREMSLFTEVSTTAPDKLKDWYKQRRRWTIGGIQCISKYKKEFFKKGMLGMFVLPFFVVQFFLGILGLAVFLYVGTTKIISQFLMLTYSLPMDLPLLTVDSLFITPSFLDYLGIVLFVIGTIFTLFSLSMMKRGAMLKKQNIFDFLFFSVIYLSVYPFITISAVYNYFKGNNKWR